MKTRNKLKQRIAIILFIGFPLLIITAFISYTETKNLLLTVVISGLVAFIFLIMLLISILKLRKENEIVRTGHTTIGTIIGDDYIHPYGNHYSYCAIIQYTNYKGEECQGRTNYVFYPPAIKALKEKKTVKIAYNENGDLVILE